MKKIFAAAAVALCFSAGFFSCITDEEDPEAILEFAEEIQDIPGTGGEFRVDVTSNTRWSIDTALMDSTIVTECYIDREGNISAIGDNTVRFSVAENVPGENGEFLARTVKIVIFVDDPYVPPLSRELTVIQGPGAYRVKLDKTEQKVAAAPGQFPVTVDVNGPWAVDYPAGFVIEQGEGENEHIIEYPGNTSGGEREFVITFRITAEPYPSAELKIIQAGT